MTLFSELGLAAPIQAALAAEGYTKPTPIQAQAIPQLMEGRDLLGIAQTGTGKTAAFGLPALHHLQKNPKPRPAKGCRMLVLAPTRELASQIAESMNTYGKGLRLSAITVFGGVPINRQIRQLQAGVDILVATPGRLLDLIDQRALTLRDVEIFVLDEADQMLDLGFIHALKRIVPLLPKKRQSLFFSATMPKTIGELADKFLTDPVKVAVAPVASTAERVDQYITYVNQSEKQALLTLKLREFEIGRALVFSRTKHGADRIVRHLTAAGLSAGAIHGNKSQPQRERTLLDFRAGKVPILIATDIAARGIDVDGVTHVFNFDIPDVAEQYVHRIGRTARAGASGMALAFVSPEERGSMRDVEKLTRVKPTEMPLPSDFLVEAKRLPAPSAASRDDRERDALGARGRNDGRGGGRGRGGPQHGQHHRGGTNRDTSRDASPRGPVANPLARPEGGRGHSGNARPGGWSPVAGDRPDRGERPARPQGDRPQHPRGDRPQGARPAGGRPGGFRGGRPGGARQA